MSMPNGVPQSPMWFCRIDVVAEVLQGAGQRVADDRGAQVPDVHLLGHVGRGVVDRDDLRLLGRHAEPRVGGQPASAAASHASS